VRSWIRAVGVSCGITLGMAVVLTGLANYPLVVAPLLFIAFLAVMIRHDMREWY